MTVEHSRTTACPHCGGAIKAAARFCRHCRRDIVVPVTWNVAASTRVDAAITARTTSSEGDRSSVADDWRARLHPTVRALLPLLFLALAAPLAWSKVPSSVGRDDYAREQRFWSVVLHSLPAGQVAVAPASFGIACQGFRTSNVAVMDPASAENAVAAAREEVLRDPTVRACAARMQYSGEDLDERLATCAHVVHCVTAVWTADEVRSRIDDLDRELQSGRRDLYVYGAAFLATFFAAFGLAVYLRVPAALAVREWLKTGPDGRAMS